MPLTQTEPIFTNFQENVASEETLKQKFYFNFIIRMDVVYRVHVLQVLGAASTPSTLLLLRVILLHT